MINFKGLKKWSVLYPVVGLLVFLTMSSCLQIAQHLRERAANKTQNIYSLTAYPSLPIEITIDSEGIPHINAENEEDAAYGLGYMHAQDRLYQLHFLRYVSQGRLTELFGLDYLNSDRQLRIISYRLQEEVDALKPRLKRLLAAYVEGINKAALKHKSSIEMRSMHMEWTDFSVYDVLSIYRMYAFQMSSNFKDKLLEDKLKAKFKPDDQRLKQLLKVMPAMGVAHFPQTYALEPIQKTTTDVFVPRKKGKVKKEVITKEDLEIYSGGNKVSEKYSWDFLSAGASNSWAISGKNTTSGKSMLFTDPHLRHSAPSSVYLAHLNIQDKSIAGGGWPGLPNFFWGYTPEISFSFTRSYADIQTLEVFDKGQKLQKYYQNYMYNNQIEQSEYFYGTEKSILLPNSFQHLGQEHQQYLLKWSGFESSKNSSNLLAFWDIAFADNEKEVKESLKQLNMPVLNTMLAFKNGDIAYMLAGQKQIFTRKNPKEGYLISANQRLSEDSGQKWGERSQNPYRALRIKELIEANIQTSQNNFHNYLAIQQDTLNLRAQILSPIFSRYCSEKIIHHQQGRAEQFCKELRQFDGHFTKNSKGALIFEWLRQAFIHQVLTAHVGEELAFLLEKNQNIQMAIEDALQKEAKGLNHPLFDDLATLHRENIAGFIVKAQQSCLDRLKAEIGSGPSDWLWGEAHHSSYPSILNNLILNPIFKTGENAEDGCSDCVRTEIGTPIESGAALRLGVEMKTPLHAKMIGDLGQSAYLQDYQSNNFLERFRDGELLSDESLSSENRNKSPEEIVKILKFHVYSLENEDEINSFDVSE